MAGEQPGPGRERQAAIYRDGVFGRRPRVPTDFAGLEAGWQSCKATVRRAGGEYDACLDPNSPDYDCAGGSGDGPDYTGPVRVAGDDPHGLDRDGDGYACEA